jgi:hypothetical protein
VLNVFVPASAVPIICFSPYAYGTDDADTYVRFEVSTAVTMMIIIFWEMTPSPN